MRNSRADADDTLAMQFWSDEYLRANDIPVSDDISAILSG
jgi:hypothetical protein